MRDITISDRWFNRIVVAAVGLGFLAIVAAGIAATLTIIENERQTRWVNHTYQVERAISRYRVLEERLEAARRGYLLRHDHRLSDTFTATAAELEPALHDLQTLSADNARQQENVAQARALSRDHLATLQNSVTLVRMGRRTEALESFNFDESLPQIRRIRSLTERMLGEEDRLLQERNLAQKDSLQLFYVILAGAALLLLLVGAGSIWLILRYTRDLTASRTALQSLNANLEGAVRERTVDLQRANEEIQRFAYIVSHDLRSPLVNVMGFTAELDAAAKRLGDLVDKVEAEAPEIASEDARLAAREDLPEAIGFIRSSTQKMDRLINAILRLSREGRRPITPERLDMDALVKGIVDSLRHRIDELEVDLAPPHGLPEIVSDRLAIEQIFSNIIENALKYLHPDRTGRIVVSGRIRAGRAHFSIADNGRGIDPRDHDRIFDLFRRSGQQDQPGEGIGLAHTRALAYRLGGTITVESELGSGAIFLVTLPITFQGEQGQKDE